MSQIYCVAKVRVDGWAPNRWDDFPESGVVLQSPGRPMTRDAAERLCLRRNAGRSNGTWWVVLRPGETPRVRDELFRMAPEYAVA